MGNITPQLEAALARFAAQPGTTPDQEAQLRDAVVADADWLDLLNRQAVAGQLKGFASGAPGGAPNLTGWYDKPTGVITVPKSSFRLDAAIAGDDLKAVVGLQAITVDFAHKHWQASGGTTHTVDQDMVANLQATLNGSPVLAAQIKGAVKQGHVQHFSLLGDSIAAGATYDGQEASARDPTPKGINLPPSGLQSRSPANPHGRYDVTDMTFVLGHEVQHGFNDAAKDQAMNTFVRSIAAQAQALEPVHDYTDELRAYIEAGRNDEAGAEIAGWNALLSRERQDRPHISGVDLMAQTSNNRVFDFVSVDPATGLATLRSGLTLNPDGSLSQTPANIAAMGRHYFDRPAHLYAQPHERALALGEHQPNPTSDYPNYYGTWAIEAIVAAEDRANVRIQGVRPQIAIDMAALGLREDLLEMEGLDLGADRTPRPYLDIGQTPPALRHFHHTQDASMGHDHQHVPVAAAGRIPAGGDPLVDRWIDALQDGDHAAAKAAQQEVTWSREGRLQWNEFLRDAHAWEDRRNPRHHLSEGRTDTIDPEQAAARSRQAEGETQRQDQQAMPAAPPPQAQEHQQGMVR